MLGKVGKSLVNNSFQNNFDFHVWAKCIVQMLLCGGFYFSRKKKRNLQMVFLLGALFLTPLSTLKFSIVTLQKCFGFPFCNPSY